MPAAVVMPSVSEDGEDSMHSRDDSDPYRPMPHSPNSEPLLDENDMSADQSMQSLAEGNIPRRSVGNGSPDEASYLMRINGDAPAYSDAPRGEAPAYFEAVDTTESLPRNAPTTRETPTQPPSALPRSSTEPAPLTRRSGFRQLLSAIPNRLSMSHNSSHASHTRADSSLSLVSSENSHGRETSSRPAHRPSGSGSGSLLSLSPFRTISRQSNVNLNSPSMISLDSISAPLSHTLIRTEFTYPKSGPTPEQLKLISSREAFARFGMPYGADAIAYAASTSRHDVDVPPPDFDVSDSEIPPVPGFSHTGPSRLRSISNAEDFEEEEEQDQVQARAPQQEQVPQQVLQQSVDSSVADDVGPARPYSPHDRAHETSAHHVSQTENAPVDDNGRDTNSSSTTSSSTPPSNSRPADLATAAPPSSYKAPDLEESKVSSIHSNAAGGLGLGVPSYSVSSIYDRSVSRASSVQTFATAAESMHTGSSQIDFDHDQNPGHSDTSAPGTPKVSARPVLPSTDATVARTGTTSTEAHAK
jgi:hypothetical protein